MEINYAQLTLTEGKETWNDNIALMINFKSLDQW